MNSLEIVFRTKHIKLERDKRYKLMVSLMRTDRPRYWNFLCFNCGSKVCELANRDVDGITDFYDPQDLGNTGVIKHCKGTLPDGLPCPYSYFFNVH